MLEVVRFVNSRFTSNTYILSHPEYDDVWVVDPGDTENIFKWMNVHSKTVITGVLLTHAHFDHIYGMNDILSLYSQCTVYVANEYGKELLNDPKKNGSKYTKEGPTVINDSSRVGFYFGNMTLWDDTAIKVIYTPGHSDDSVCFMVENMLFTGDTLIKDVRTVTKLKTGSKVKLSESLRLLEGYKGSGLIVHPGHEELFALDEYDLTNSEGNGICLRE